MKTSKWENLLGLAARAGKVISGEELVVKSIQKQNAKIVLLSKDASDNTKKKVTDKCLFYNIDIVWIDDRSVLGKAIGKEQRVVVAVNDQGFSKRLKELLDH
ncbi:YlxQ family RNA-binding protein [Fictibacillus barbaricus]|uniref:Ribosomal protein L7Ae-like RNA K-turn-binding protein n=1 Tax=Fictibacillus barbaricus TaxID=182136 RepID=A0ABU1TY78_9BACL|nr:YlxQ family RNA-binding protein [Fictibacillus barbaricus]MDR7072182.1 ribosomal protein L7Ae-like RNA K-turn-binding protein [Fictibacillus barbaricus]